MGTKPNKPKGDEHNEQHDTNTNQMENTRTEGLLRNRAVR